MEGTIVGVLIAVLAYCLVKISEATVERIRNDKRVAAEPPKAVIVHAYKTSKDYERLWDLLMEGRYIIRIGTQWGRFGTEIYCAYLSRYPNNDRYVIYGMGDCKDFENIKRDDFINYCKWKKIEYLDQVDVGFKE